MLQVPNAAAQLMAGSLLERDVLCFKRRIRGDVLRHVLGPDDFLRKQIKAGRGKNREEVKHKTVLGNKKQIKGKNSLSNHVFLRDAALLGLLAFVHGLGVFSSEDRG
jgi:hypothetical protein